MAESGEGDVRIVVKKSTSYDVIDTRSIVVGDHQDTKPKQKSEDSRQIELMSPSQTTRTITVNTAGKAAQESSTEASVKPDSSEADKPDLEHSPVESPAPELSSNKDRNVYITSETSPQKRSELSDSSRDHDNKAVKVRILNRSSDDDDDTLIEIDQFKEQPPSRSNADAQSSSSQVVTANTSVLHISAKSTTECRSSVEGTMKQVSGLASDKADDKLNQSFAADASPSKGLNEPVHNNHDSTVMQQLWQDQWTSHDNTHERSNYNQQSQPKLYQPNSDWPRFEQRAPVVGMRPPPPRAQRHTPFASRVDGSRRPPPRMPCSSSRLNYGPPGMGFPHQQQLARFHNSQPRQHYMESGQHMHASLRPLTILNPGARPFLQRTTQNNCSSVESVPQTSDSRQRSNESPQAAADDASYKDVISNYFKETGDNDSGGSSNHSPEICDVDYTKFEILSQEDDASFGSSLISNGYLTDSPGNSSYYDNIPYNPVSRRDSNNMYAHRSTPSPAITDGMSSERHRDVSDTYQKPLSDNRMETDNNYREQMQSNTKQLVNMDYNSDSSQDSGSESHISSSRNTDSYTKHRGPEINPRVSKSDSHIQRDDCANNERQSVSADDNGDNGNCRPFQNKYRAGPTIKFHIKSSALKVEQKTPFLTQMKSRKSNTNLSETAPRFAPNTDELKRNRVSAHKSQRWAGPKSAPRTSPGARHGWFEDTAERKFDTSSQMATSDSDNSRMNTSSDATPFARDFDMSRYKRNMTSDNKGHDRDNRSRPFERKVPKNLFPEATWPSQTYCDGSLGIGNCVIAGDSITRALKEAAATREIHVVAAPGCTAYYPAQDKWNDRFWNPLEQRLSERPVVKLLILHIGTNDVGSKLESNARFVFGSLMKLLRKIRTIQPQLRIVFSSIIPRYTNQMNREVTELIPQINDIVFDVNDKMEEQSKKDNLLGFIDNHESFRDQSALYYKDGLHLSDGGSKRLAITIRTRIESELELMEKTPQRKSTNSPPTESQEFSWLLK